MPWKKLRRLKLSQGLLLILLPLLFAVSLVEVRVNTLDVERAANAAYDRSLLGALKSVDANVSTDSGALSVELPYRLLEFFELTASGPVHFRVATLDGLVELGSPDLPQPPEPLKLGVPQVYDGSYFGQPVRVVAATRALEEPTSESPSRVLLVQVAESTHARQDFARAMLRRALIENTIFLLLTVACAVGAIAFVLRPLKGLSDQLEDRDASNARPLPEDELPADIRPLARAVNHHMQRVDELVTQQRAFVDDAAHQLRTHLTTLQMQVDFARRQQDPLQIGDALTALAEELRRSTHTTNQLLSLARSDTAALEVSEFDLRGMLEDDARQFLLLARSRGVSLAVEGAESRFARGDRGLLMEALSNLLANAVKYAPQGTVVLGFADDSRGWALWCEDNGPGLPEEISRGFNGRRFARSADRGAGLGLAIAASIAARHGGILRCESASGGRGLRATLWWPREHFEGQS